MHHGFGAWRDCDANDACNIVLIQNRVMSRIRCKCIRKRVRRRVFCGWRCLVSSGCLLGAAGYKDYERGQSNCKHPFHGRFSLLQVPYLVKAGTVRKNPHQCHRMRPVKTGRWQQIENLFHAALERDDLERQSFLDEECRADTALRQEVESLLSHEAEAEKFLEVADHRAPKKGRVSRLRQVQRWLRSRLSQS
jgi:hypothetical protein